MIVNITHGNRARRYIKGVYARAVLGKHAEKFTENEREKLQRIRSPRARQIIILSLVRPCLMGFGRTRIKIINDIKFGNCKRWARKIFGVFLFCCLPFWANENWLQRRENF